jgi:hypothetical protein
VPTSGRSAIAASVDAPGGGPGPASAGEQPQLLLIGCGALARELADACRLQGLVDVELDLLPPRLHDRPDAIAETVRARIRAARAAGTRRRIVVGYADCGTGGRLDAVCADEQVVRLPGAHCYELFAGTSAIAALLNDQPGTFFLTDFLVRGFDALVVRGLGLDRRPELRDAYFGNYTRVVYLAQHPDAALVSGAHRAAEILGLPLEFRHTGLTGLATSIGAVLTTDAPALAVPA